jgi:hypothetical protein
MHERLMILPAPDSTAIRLVRAPAEFEADEACRHVIGVIAKIDEQNPVYDREHIVLEIMDSMSQTCSNSRKEYQTNRVWPHSLFSPLASDTGHPAAAG